MIVDGIQKYHGVDRLQWPLLPLFDDGQDLIGDPADRAVRNGNAVDILDVGLDIAGGHPLGVHRQDFFLNVLADAGLILFQHLGLKFPLPVPGNRHFHIPKTGAKPLAAVAIAAVVCILVFVVVLAVAQLVSIPGGFTPQFRRLETGVPM